jgi:dihydropyrimidine dehydrogenase (NAD+) subunit PreT
LLAGLPGGRAVRGRLRDASQNRKPIQIALLQRHAMDAFHDSGEAAAAHPATRNLRVACIGGGPASLACAAELCARARSATVIERRAAARRIEHLRRGRVQAARRRQLREVEMIRRMGVEFRFGVDMDSAACAGSAGAEFDFVFLGVGLGAMQRLNIPGEDSGA